MAPFVTSTKIHVTEVGMMMGDIPNLFTIFALRK
jgi:hypothetical protein